MPATEPATEPSREAYVYHALRRQSHAPERAPAGLAAPLTPSQARAMRQQAHATGTELTPQQERQMRQAALQHLRPPLPHVDTAAVAGRERSAAQRAAVQDRVLQEMQSVDFAAESTRPHLAPIAHMDGTISSQ